MATISALSEKVTSKRTELAALMRRVEIVQAEVRVWEEAEALMNQPVGTLTRRENVAKPAGGFHLEPVAVGPRAMKGAWRAIMQVVARMFAAQFSLDQLEEAASKAGHPVNRNTARSQMSNYASAGLVERVRQGHFRLTAKGRAAAGSLSVASAHVEPNTESPTANDVQAAGGSSAQKVSSPQASED